MYEYTTAPTTGAYLGGHRLASRRSLTLTSKVEALLLSLFRRRTRLCNVKNSCHPLSLAMQSIQETRREYCKAKASTEIGSNISHGGSSFGHDFAPQGVSSAIGWNFPIPPHALITDQVQSRPDCLFIASRNQGCAEQFFCLQGERCASIYIALQTTS